MAEVVEGCRLAAGQSKRVVDQPKKEFQGQSPAAMTYILVI